MSKPTSAPSDRVLVFTIDDSTPGKRIGGLEEVLDFIRGNPRAASLTDLFASSGGYKARQRWEFTPRTTMNGSAGPFFLRVHAPDQYDRLAAALNSDSRVAVRRVPPYRRLPGVRSTAAAVGTGVLPQPWSADDLRRIATANADPQWGLTTCGFPRIWKSLDGASARPIGMVDIGNDRRHRELAGRIIHCEPPTFGAPSIVDHASSVAAIMAARRGEPHHAEEGDMDGCCSAEIVLYNVWTRDRGLDQQALYNAIQEAIDSRLPVLNMSIWLDEPDDHLEELLRSCEDKGVVVVAAMGNAGTSGETFYPAAYPNVIAVAATNPLDQRNAQSSVGPHAFIAAPGENILTAIGNDGYDRVSGTSFAAAFVSAAVWLARRNRELEPVQVRWLLSRSVANPEQGRNSELGYGRLDMDRLAQQLPHVPEPGVCAQALADELEIAENKGAEFVGV